jgi:hypothetical protein
VKKCLCGFAMMGAIAMAPAPALSADLIVPSIIYNFGPDGGTFIGGLLNPGETDYFTFYSKAGDVLTIRTLPVEGQFDTVLTLLYDQTGPVEVGDLIDDLFYMDFDDDHGGGLLSRIDYPVGTDGYYAIAVGVFGQQGGVYSLSLSGNTGPTIPSDAVPEPATWAMMLLGFGAIGASLRRRIGAPVVAA